MQNFWNGKRVLITGADGFIGSHLVEYLQKRGAVIRALAIYNSFNFWGWLDHIETLENVEVISGDIRDAENCARMTENMEIVFHLACLISVPHSIVNPRSYLDNNITGTFNICQAAQKSNSKLIYISSSEVYGTAKYLPIDESHPLQAQSPYSASKISAEAIVYSFFRSYGLQAVIARPFNTYGPRQSARAIIPSVIIQIANGKKELSLGNTSPRRDMNFVADTCHGIALIAGNDGLVGETVNIGSGKDYAVSEMITLICKIMKKDVSIVTDPLRVRASNSEVEHLLCNNAKIKLFTGFEPAYSFEKGLEETINWFKTASNIALYKSQIYNV